MGKLPGPAGVFRKIPITTAQSQPADHEKKPIWKEVIQIGSEVFELGNPRFANYVAAKGAQLGLTRSWARELAPYGITVNLIAPGWIPTEEDTQTRRLRNSKSTGYLFP